MGKLRTLIWLASLIIISGCSTINESLELGAVTGFTSGALATYAGYSISGSKPNLEAVVSGAGIGLGVGLLASYFIHHSIEAERIQNSSDQMEMQFGDLPPNPFLVPKVNIKKGVKR